MVKRWKKTLNIVCFVSVSSLSHSLANILNTFCIFSSKLLRWNLRSYLYSVRVWMPWLITWLGYLPNIRLGARRGGWSPRCRHMGGIDKSVPSKKWMSLVKPLSRRQASLIMQLRTGQIGLNKHLHRIRRSDTPYCPNCNENAVETIHHFLFDCARYRSEWSILHRKLRRRSHNLSYLLSHPAATLPLLKYVHSTGRLKQTFGALCSENQLSANTS